MDKNQAKIEFFKAFAEGMPRAVAHELYDDILGPDFIDRVYDEEKQKQIVNIEHPAIEKVHETLEKILNRLEKFEIPSEIKVSEVKKPEWFEFPEIKIPEFPSEIRISNFPEIHIPEFPEEIEIRKPYWLPDFGKIVKSLVNFLKKNVFRVKIEGAKEPLKVNLVNPKDIAPRVVVSGGSLSRDDVTRALNDSRLLKTNDLSFSTEGYLQVEVASGGAGGGLAQVQVRDSSNSWTDVGYYTGNLNLPVSLEADNTGTKDVNITNTSITVDDGGGSLTVDGTVNVGNTVTVQATDLDIRDLSSATDSVACVQSGAWTVSTELNTDDLDTGTGTDTQAIVGIALPGDGGHTLWDGTVTIQEPLSVDDGGGSLTIDTPQLPSSLTANGNLKVSLEEDNTGTKDVNVTNTSLTVTATDLDIRNLDSSTDSVSAVQSGTWTVKITDGTETASVNASNQLEVAVGNTVTISDGGSTISVDDGGGSLTVDGTVNVGNTVTVTATDLDIRNLSSAQDSVVAKKGDTAYTKVHKHATYSTAQTDTAIWTPATDKKFVITDICISTDTAMTITLKDGGTQIYQWHFAANGGAVLNLQTPYESSAANNSLTITTSTDGNVAITVQGYEK